MATPRTSTRRTTGVKAVSSTVDPEATVAPLSQQKRPAQKSVTQKSVTQKSPKPVRASTKKSGTTASRPNTAPVDSPTVRDPKTTPTTATASDAAAETTRLPAVPTPTPKSTSVEFAAAARLLTRVARDRGLLGPSFRCPPRLIGVDRSIRRTPTAAVVSVRLRGRPFVAVLADMIEGVVVANRLTAPEADRLRSALWLATGAEGGVASIGPVAGSVAEPIAGPGTRVA